MKKKLRMIMVWVLIFVSGCSNLQNLTTNNQDVYDSEIKEPVPSLEITAEATVPPTLEPTQEPTVTQKPELSYTYIDKNLTMYAIDSGNVKDLPEKDGKEIGKFAIGEEIHVTGICNETGWYRISYQEADGYILSEYLSETKPGTTIVNANGTTNTTPIVVANGKKVAIDAGHQQRGISEKEPNAPGSSQMKNKLTSGTAGVKTGIAEYILNLQVSMYLKEELLSRGYEVFMIRENHDCPISNAERAMEANNSGSDIFVRIHANSLNDASVGGGLTMSPSANNKYVGHMVSECMRLSTLIAEHMNRASGFRNRGVQQTDTMTGINWCQIPVTIVEMGFMSNPEEDVKLSQESVQRAIAKGIADGIDVYFGF